MENESLMSIPFGGGGTKELNKSTTRSTPPPLLPHFQDVTRHGYGPVAFSSFLLWPCEGGVGNASRYWKVVGDH